MGNLATLKMTCAGILAPILILVLAVSQPAHTQSNDPDVAPEPAGSENGEESDATIVRLGVGALTLPDFEGADDYSTLPLPIIEVRNWYGFDVSFRELSYRLYRYSNDAESEFKKFELRIEPSLSPSASRREDGRFLFFDRGDNKYLKGLGDIDTGLDIGANVYLRTGPVQTRVSVRKAVAGGHDGFTAEVGLGTQIPFSERTSLAIEAATTWADDTYMDAFFSVDRGQAWRSIYRRYDADAGFKDASLGLRFNHDITDRISLLSVARYSRLLGDAADSPIVEGPGGTQDQFTILLGLTYEWQF